MVVYSGNLNLIIYYEVLMVWFGVVVFCLFVLLVRDWLGFVWLFCFVDCCGLFCVCVLMLFLVMLVHVFCCMVWFGLVCILLLLYGWCVLVVVVWLVVWWFECWLLVSCNGC